MHIESLDLIVSVNSSSYGDYKGKKANECCITIEIQHTFKTLKNPESERRFAPNCVGYTACDFVAFHDTTAYIFSFSGGAPV